MTAGRWLGRSPSSMRGPCTSPTRGRSRRIHRGTRAARSAATAQSSASPCCGKARHRRDHHPPARRPELHAAADRAARDLRRPGGHRHRERPPVQEVQARNRELTETLEQQTATGEILRVISSSPTDVQPVFDTIVRSAGQLCEALFCVSSGFDGELIHLVAHTASRRRRSRPRQSSIRCRPAAARGGARHPQRAVDAHPGRRDRPRYRARRLTRRRVSSAASSPFRC